jgi:hypothetical protein
MGRDRKHRRGDDADGATFVRLPCVVITSPGYRQASHTARSLLIDVAQQFDGRNNGRLTAAAKYLEPLGWKSPGVVAWALRELQACGLLVMTRQGGLNRPSWFALTWRGLHQATDLDIDPKRFRRGEYMRPEPVPARPSHARKAKDAGELSTTPGVAVAATQVRL